MNKVNPEYETALHEAAHAFILWKFFPTVRFSIDLHNDGQANGHCMINPQDFYLLYRQYTDDQLRLDTVFSMAGDAAESLLHGKDHPDPDHAKQDLVEGRKRINLAFASSRELTQQLKTEIGLRQEKYEVECFIQAKELIDENKKSIEKIARKLIEVRVLAGDEIAKLF